MYVTGRRKSGNVRLVRMSRYDGYVSGAGNRRRQKRLKRKKRRALWMLLLIPVSAGIFNGVRIDAGDGGTTESVVVVENIPLSSSNTEEPGPDAGEGQIVLLEEQEPKTPLVVIDPGHGGADEGCSRGETQEKEINLQLAMLLKEKLTDMGIDAVLTREDNLTEVSLEDRVSFAEENQADLFVSIHQNACEEGTDSAEGVETWYPADDPDSLRLARLVHMGAVDQTGAKERELMESDGLYVLRETSMPACLIETAFLSNAKEREAISDPAYQDKMADGIAWGIKYFFYPKTMYLTFDDGPSEENTAAVLDILKKYNIQATFFVVGENVRRHPEIAKRIVEEGHTIGIHCYRHEYETLYESVDNYLEDFEKAYDAVYEVTGVEAQLFRFPGGSINSYNKDVYQEIIDKMTEKGFVYFDWNGSLEDATKDNAPEKLLQNARESTLGRKKIVMLAHDIIYNTVLCLEDLIRQFPDYKMEPLTPDVAPIQF